MVVLPYDIWLHICSFLSKRDLWYLRFVNKTIYEMAMDRAHKEVVVSLSDLSHSKLERQDFLRFTNQDLAKRVRELSFVHYDPSNNRDCRTYPEKMGLKERLKNFIMGKNDRTLLIGTFEGFTRVQSLKVEYADLWEKVLQDSIPLLQTSLLAATDTIRSLSLSIPFEDLEVIVPPSLSLPRLSSFSLTIFGSRGTGSSKIGGMFANTSQTLIAPLINRHRHTLTSIDLRLRHPRLFWSMVLDDSPTDFDITPLYRGLEHIPHLSSLGLSVNHSTDLDIVVPFLDMHTDTVQSFSLYMMDPKSQQADMVFDRVNLQGSHFPNLGALNIEYLETPDSYPIPPQDLESTPKFVNDHSSSLKSVTTVGKSLSQYDVVEFFRPRGQTDSYERLANIKITLQFVTPELFTLFQSALPNLEELGLSIRKFKQRLTSPEIINDEYQFCMEIGQQDYSHWNLKFLTLSIKNRPFANNIQKSYGALALANALTSLQTFNNLPRHQYISQARAEIDGSNIPEIAD